MAENQNKTTETDSDVRMFLGQVENEKRREDAFAVLDLMQEVMGEEPKMWGSSIVGFGKYHYRYDSGREGDMCVTGFSPRKQALTLYIMGDFEERDMLLGKLGKHTTGKGCLYIKKLEDVDLDVLRQLIRQSADWVLQQYPD